MSAPWRGSAWKGTEQQRSDEGIRLAKRIEKWQKRLGPLGVAHWSILMVSVVSDDEMPGGSGADASVQPQSLYDSCRFWFCEDYLDRASVEQVDHTILHEWVHVSMRDLDMAIESAEEQLAPAVRDIWGDRIHHEREALVEHMARQLYAFHTG